MDAETGLYYYGARYYEPELAMWYGVDALAEKYPNMGGYVYCAGNPVKLVDVDGRKIYLFLFKTDSNGCKTPVNYMYDRANGRLMEYSGLDENLNALYEKTVDVSSDSFEGKVLSALNEIGTYCTGENILDYYEENDVTIYQNGNIDSWTIPNGDGNYTESKEPYNVILNSSGLGSLIPTTDGVQLSPFGLDVAHELAHNKDFRIRGDKARAIWLEMGPVKILDSEKYATFIENVLRKDSNLPLRSHYGKVTYKNNEEGYEPSRLINKKGKLLYEYDH